MLDTEGDADDGHAAERARHCVTERQPEPGEDKPDDVADRTEHGSPDVALQRQVPAVDDFLTERCEREIRNGPAGARPRDAYD